MLFGTGLERSIGKQPNSHRLNQLSTELSMAIAMRWVGYCGVSRANPALLRLLDFPDRKFDERIKQKVISLSADPRSFGSRESLVPIHCLGMENKLNQPSIHQDHIRRSLRHLLPSKIPKLLLATWLCAPPPPSLVPLIAITYEGTAVFLSPLRISAPMSPFLALRSPNRIRFERGMCDWSWIWI